MSAKCLCWSARWISTAGCLLVAMVSSMPAGARPPAPVLLPETTVAFVSVRDVPDTWRRFMNTALGRMSQDPQMRPFLDDVYRSLTQAAGPLEDRLGLSLGQLLAAPQGELALAVVAPGDRPLAVVAVLDTDQGQPDVRGLLPRVAEQLEQSGARKSEQSVGGTRLLIFDGVGRRRRRLVMFQKGATVVVGSDAEVLRELLARWEGPADATLADDGRFAAIMQRCRGQQDEPPQLLWYVDPIMLMRSMGRQNPGVQLAVAVLPVLGLDDVQAFGGTVALDLERSDSLIHAHLLLDSGGGGIREMLTLRPVETTPEGWVPGDVASYMTLRLDVQTSYKTAQRLYDGFRGEGALAALLDRRVRRPIGLDFETELLPALDGRITHATWVERPVGPTSQATLVALKLRQRAPVAELLEKLFAENEPFLIRDRAPGAAYYQFAPPQLGEGPNAPVRPRPCFGLVDDYLVITDRPSLYQKVVSTAANPSESLARALDYKLVASRIGRQSSARRAAMISFERPQEGMRIVYQMAIDEPSREQLRRRAERNPLMKSLNQALEGRTLPPFAVLERYLAPQGALVTDEETGIHYTAFSMRRTLD